MATHNEREAVPTEKFILIIITAITALFLLWTCATQLSGMSTGFAGKVAVNEWSFHPHHLLYQPTLVILFRLVEPLECSAVCVGQIVGIFWAVVTALSVYVIARRALNSILGAAFAVAFLIVSHGFIIFSTQLEPYGPILGIITTLAAILVLNDGPPVKRSWNVLFFLLFSLALFYHQAMVLFLIPVAVFLAGTSGRHGLVWLVKMTAASGIFVLSLYIFVFWSIYPADSFVDFYRWIRYYGVISDSFHGTVDLSSDRLKPLIRSVTQLFVVRPPSPEYWIGSDTEFGRVQTPLRYLFLFFLPLVFVWNASQVAKGIGRPQLRVFLLSWWAVFGLFFFWWHAGVYKFFIPILSSIVILTVWMVTDWIRLLQRGFLKVVATSIGAILLAAIAMSNLNATVLPLKTSKGALFDQARKLSEMTPSTCTLYSMRYLQGYLNLYFNQRSIPFNYMFRKFYYSSRDPAISRTLRVPETFEDQPCGVIALYWVSREYFELRTTWAIGEYLDPEDWHLFISWFFDVRPENGRNSTVITHSQFHVSEDSDGDRYVIIDRKRRVTEKNLEALMKKIETLYAEQSGDSFSGPSYRRATRLNGLAFGYF